MSLKNILILVKPHLINLVNSSKWLAIIMLLTCIFTFFYSWDGTELFFLDIPLEGYKPFGNQALIICLNEFFSWTWIILSFYILLKLMFPLGDSFLVSELLWLRLTPCKPAEIAASRAIWILSYAILLGILGGIWSILTAFVHQISPNPLFINVLGLVSHVILSGGIIVILDFGLTFDFYVRKMIAVIALFIPWILKFISMAIDKVAILRIIKFFPYTIPFQPPLSDNIYHFGTAAIIGIVFLGIHILLKAQYMPSENK